MPWSTQTGDPGDALTDVTPSPKTALWDAVVAAGQQLAGRDSTTRAIVLLTDGRDNASVADVQSALKVVSGAHVRVFAVGLAGAKLDRADLQTIVDRTGGEFIEVQSADQLTSVYAGLARRLNHQYLLTYTSQQRTAPVRRSSFGRGWGRPSRSSATRCPREQPSRSPPARTTAVDSWARIWPWPGSHWRSARPCCWARSWRSVPCASLRRGASQVRAGFAFAGRRRLPRSPGAAVDAGDGPVVAARDVVPVQRRRRPGRHRAAPGRIVLFAAAASLAAAIVVAVITGRPLTAIVVAPLGPIIAWVYVTRRASSWYAHFDSTLADSLTVLASSLRAGHSLLQAIAHVAEEADDRVSAEWHETVRRTRLGIAVEDALDEMVVRVGNRDLQWIALVARVQHQAGGNMAEMFDIVAETVRQRHRLRDQIQALTAQGRMSRWVLTIMPFAMAAMFFVLSPTYIQQLYSPLGLLLVVVSCVSVMIGSFWLKRITEIEV